MSVVTFLQGFRKEQAGMMALLPATRFRSEGCDTESRSSSLKRCGKSSPWDLVHTQPTRANSCSYHTAFENTQITR